MPEAFLSGLAPAPLTSSNCAPELWHGGKSDATEREILLRVARCSGQGPVRWVLFPGVLQTCEQTQPGRPGTCTWPA